MLAATIDDVIRLLGERVARARAAESPLGYFPALYRRVTIRINAGIARGEFDDNPRMERMDVIFANRYLRAAAALDQGKPAPKSWALTFEAAEHWSPLVLQHLLLGMNAHINFDLGIAAVHTAPGALLPSFRNDFDRINAILGELLGSVKADLEEIWPGLEVLDELAGNADDQFANFSLRKARNAAWALAERLAPLSHDDQRAVIEQTDHDVACFGRALWHPGMLVEAPALIMRLAEHGDVCAKIDRLTT